MQILRLLQSPQKVEALSALLISRVHSSQNLLECYKCFPRCREGRCGHFVPGLRQREGSGRCSQTPLCHCSSAHSRSGTDCVTAATTTAEPSRCATPPEAVSARGTPNSGCVPVTHALIGKKNIVFPFM